MSKLRRSKSLEGISISTRTFTADLVRRFTSKRDPKALAASSASIALSISFAFKNARGASKDDSTFRGKDSGWQAAYATAKMAIEIAKETSDIFFPLKTLAGALFVLIQNFDRTEDNTKAARNIKRRIHSLSGVLAAPVGEDDYPEKARRAEFRMKLEGVVAELEPLSEQRTLLKFLRNVDNAKTLAGFIQELADAITDYQVSVQQGTYGMTRNIYEKTENVRKETRDIRKETRNIRKGTRNIQDDTKNILDVAELEILERLQPVRNAGYKGGHHDKCFPGTREPVLQKILLWAKSPRHQNVFWLNGLAGTGKSTIAQSIAETLADNELLGASFFCSRDFLDRGVLKNIFPTLGYQLACRYPHFRKCIIRIIKKDPTLAHTSLITQLENLLVNPLSEAKVSCVIVIDALDECIDDQPASAILSVLGRFVKELPLVRFFITGRPEPRIRTGFRLPLLEPLTQIFLLHGVETTDVSKDIQLYLRQKLSAIANQRSDIDLPNPWPHDHEIVTLTEKSGGLFIFASTIARFIESPHHEPNERLQLILSETSGTTHEGRAGIDSLYGRILLHAFPDSQEVNVLLDINRVLGSIILAFNPLSRKELSIILGVPANLISTALRHLHSVILVPPGETQKIHVFHKSFPDFLQDPKRCTHRRFHVDPGTHHADIFLSCLRLVHQVKPNPCGIPPFTANQDVHDLPQLMEQKLGGGARYACSYWAKHLHLSTLRHISPVVQSLTGMLKNAAPWIEVMSLENRLGEVIHLMNTLLIWADGVASDSSISKLATGWLRLAMYFFHPIQTCAQQIYHTALLLSPTSPDLRSTYRIGTSSSQVSRLTAFYGAPHRWGPTLTTINVGLGRITCIGTFAQKIVVACEEVLNIYDAVTFVLEQSLRAPQSITRVPTSEDESILYLVHYRSVTLWDVQTGGLIDSFTTRCEIRDVAVSPTGDQIACGLSNGFVTLWSARTKQESRLGNGQPLVAIRWLSSQELVVAANDSIYFSNTAATGFSGGFNFPGPVWGIVNLGSDGLLVVYSKIREKGKGQEYLTVQFSQELGRWKNQGSRYHELIPYEGQLPKSLKQPLVYPINEDKMIACITRPQGVQVLNAFNGSSDRESAICPSPLKTARSMAVSLRRNLVIQTEDHVRIFSTEVLGNDDSQSDGHASHVHPLGKKYIIYLRPDRRLIILETKTLRIRDSSSLKSIRANQFTSARTPPDHGVVAEFGVPMVLQAWSSRTPLPMWPEGAEENALLGGLSPSHARIATIYDLPRRELRLKSATDGTTLAKLPLENGGLEAGVVYDLTFDSETRFYLSIDGPGGHSRVPHDIIPSPSGKYSYTIRRGKAVPISRPHKINKKSPYILDSNLEWVLDAQRRKICWIPPEYMRRGNGGHFWAGLSLVMLGNDAVVRALSFKEPDS